MAGVVFWFAMLGLAALCAAPWLLRRLYRDPTILAPRRWPEDFWRHGRFRRRRGGRVNR